MDIKDTRAGRFAPNSYLNRFFSEKDLATATFEKEAPSGSIHILDTEVVIEHISIAGDDELRRIEGVIRRIDFLNGDLNHFFDHLAGAIASLH